MAVVLLNLAALQDRLGQKASDGSASPVVFISSFKQRRSLSLRIQKPLLPILGY